MARLVKTKVEMEGRYEERWVLLDEDVGPEWAPDDELRRIGRPATRISGPERVAGTARYVSDLALPGMLHAAVLRSPHAHARVRSLDVDAARATPGVRCVLGPGDAPPYEEQPTLTDAPQYAGHGVAAVAADTPEAAAAGLAALAPAFEELPFVVEPEEALARQELADEPEDYVRGDPDRALAEADVVVDARYTTPAQLHNALEPHCAVAWWEPSGVTLWVSTQGIFAAREELAGAFDLDPDRVRVVCEYMGGGFGAKQGTGVEGMLATELSRRTRRPVSLVYGRREENVSAGHRSASVQTYRIGARRDGTLHGIEATALQSVGAWGERMPILTPATTAYRCDHVRAMTLPVKVNLGFSNSFRAPGVMEGAFGFECAMDELALALAMDPIELRRRNHVADDQESGEPYTSKRVLACYARCAELAGWERRDELHAGGGQIRRGMGVAGQIWWGGGGPPAHAALRLGANGTPVLTVGFQDIGTGTMTAVAAIVAELLGVDVGDVRVHAGDTARAGYGPTSGGSMTLASVAPAVRSAAWRVRRQLLELAGDVFEISPDDLTLVDGEFRSVDGVLRRPLAEVTEKLGDASLFGTGSRGPNPDGMRVHTFGCQIAQVAVDTVTGAVRVERVVAVHDVGRIINPLGARSQVIGGVLQGVGFALTEERIVDPTTGTVVNAGLEDYKVPTIADVPEIVCDFVGLPDPHLATGIKGLGEPPVIPTAPAIGNAIAHATGVRLREAPFTPRRVLEALA